MSCQYPFIENFMARLQALMSKNYICKSVQLITHEVLSFQYLKRCMKHVFKHAGSFVDGAVFLNVATCSNPLLQYIESKSVLEPSIARP